MTKVCFPIPFQQGKPSEPMRAGFVLALRYHSFRLLTVCLLTSCVGSQHGVAQNVTVTWQGQQLGAALQRLADSGSLPCWLDRRVDPAQKVDQEFNNVPVRQAFAALAANYGLGSFDLGELIYVGPPETTRGLAALILEARSAAKRTPSASRSRWLETSAVDWPRLTEPRLYLETTLAKKGITLEDSHRLPHDLWEAKRFPQLSLVDQTVLVLTGFGLTCEIGPSGRTCRIVPIEYPLPDRTREFEANRPKAKRSAKQTTARSQYSLKLTNQPVGGVIGQLAAQLQIEVNWDQSSLNQYDRSQQTLISCEVKNVGLQELLQAVLGPAGMSFSLEEKQLTILGAP